MQLSVLLADVSTSHDMTRGKPLYMTEKPLEATGKKNTRHDGCASVKNGHSSGI